jgi:hypothetical protein
MRKLPYEMCAMGFALLGFASAVLSGAGGVRLRADEMVRLYAAPTALGLFAVLCIVCIVMAALQRRPFRMMAVVCCACLGQGAIQLQQSANSAAWADRIPAPDRTLLLNWIRENVAPMPMDSPHRKHVSLDLETYDAMETRPPKGGFFKGVKVIVNVPSLYGMYELPDDIASRLGKKTLVVSTDDHKQLTYEFPLGKCGLNSRICLIKESGPLPPEDGDVSLGDGWYLAERYSN